MSWFKSSLLIAGLAVLGAASQASAVLSYNSEASRMEYIHDPIVGNDVVAPPSGTVNTGVLIHQNPSGYFQPPSAAGTNYQFKSTDTRPSGGGSSVAVISTARVQNATTVGVQISAGTGISQNNPIGAYTGASSLLTDFVLTYDNNTSNFGPANGSASFTVGGTVGAGANAFASFTATLNFYQLVEGEEEESSLVDLRTPIVFSQTFKRGNPVNNTATTTFTTNGVFTKSFSSSARLTNPFTGSLFPPGAVIEIFGQIEFQARNAESPTDIHGSGGVFAGSNPAPEPVTSALGVLASIALGAASTRRRSKA